MKDLGIWKMRKQKEEPPELKEILEQIKLEDNRVRETPEYISLSKEINDRYSQANKIDYQLRRLRGTIAGKYVSIRHHFGYSDRWDIYDVKSSVKAGIKRGLGIKHICLINDDDIVKVVKEIIKKDLENTDEKIMQDKLGSLRREEEAKLNEREILFKEYRSLVAKRDTIMTKLNSKDCIKEQKKKENSKFIAEKLPEFINNIQKEVNKELMLDKLSNNKQK